MYSDRISSVVPYFFIARAKEVLSKGRMTPATFANARMALIFQLSTVNSALAGSFHLLSLGPTTS